MRLSKRKVESSFTIACRLAVHGGRPFGDWDNLQSDRRRAGEGMAALQSAAEAYTPLSEEHTATRLTGSARPQGMEPARRTKGRLRAGCSGPGDRDEHEAAVAQCTSYWHRAENVAAALAWGGTQRMMLWRARYGRKTHTGPRVLQGLGAARRPRPIHRRGRGGSPT